MKARKHLLRISLALVAAITGGAGALSGVCGPFTDTAADAFCPFVLEIFYLGITTGTTPTSFSPAADVTRLQMAAFLSRTVDRAVQRIGTRAALRQFWTPQTPFNLGTTTVGVGPQLLASDGADVWVACAGGGTVYRVSGGAGKVLDFWDAPDAVGILIAMGRVFITGASDPGQLRRIDPAQGAGIAGTVATNLGSTPRGIAFDGTRIWTANSGSVSIVTPGATLPWTVTTVTTGFGTLFGALFDGANIWVTDQGTTNLFKLNVNGAILQTVTVGANPAYAVFDGANIWVPNSGAASLSVVRASTGAVLATLTGNGLSNPASVAFDGERVLATNQFIDSVSLFKAADFEPLGSISTGTGTFPYGACADGRNFWISLNTARKVARF